MGNDGLASCGVGWRVCLEEGSLRQKSVSSLPDCWETQTHHYPFLLSQTLCHGGALGTQVGGLLTRQFNVHTDVQWFWRPNQNWMMVEHIHWWEEENLKWGMDEIQGWTSTKWSGHIYSKAGLGLCLLTCSLDNNSHGSNLRVDARSTRGMDEADVEILSTEVTSGE